ncbi:uncharacterized protein F5Z01DRAFT_315284 [Emericellopsis atlantica]|uniref:Uncharacterized protein n=1 Tax=Emericellopsis atlantica TaxID=2614577 RepID=A0A9P8CSF8_9HYPO|nr:uncharacterized protein F5Z01DRAFT_315284 [Emericellopsis atlantica]KAG9258044.1 hypothetical protein F5Z01DRAFT_315284 [Emericellopsis atlantica]
MVWGLGTSVLLLIRGIYNTTSIQVYSNKDIIIVLSSTASTNSSSRPSTALPGTQDIPGTGVNGNGLTLVAPYVWDFRPKLNSDYVFDPKHNRSPHSTPLHMKAWYVGGLIMNNMSKRDPFSLSTQPPPRKVINKTCSSSHTSTQNNAATYERRHLSNLHRHCDSLPYA